jgi:uncharacterized protein YbjT (DUF2867 family)
MSIKRRAFLTLLGTVPTVFAASRRVHAAQKPVVFLAGATGRNGSAVLRALLALPKAPFTVIAMSREPAKARDKFPQARWVEGDVTQPESLARAMQGGVDIIVSAVATAQGEGPNRPERVDAQGTRNLIAAGRQAGAKRFVIITSSVSGRVDHPLNKRVGNVLVYKAEAEKALYESGMDYVVVGPAGMTDEPAGQKKILLIPRDQYRPGMTIGRDDTARVIVHALTDPGAANRTFTVAYGDGPDDGSWKAAFATLPRR